MPKRRVTFVLRLWVVDESSSDGHSAHLGALRGSLQPVDEAETQHFASLQQLVLLLQMIVEELLRRER